MISLKLLIAGKLRTRSGVLVLTCKPL